MPYTFDECLKAAKDYVNTWFIRRPDNLSDGDTIIWDASENEFVPGTASGTGQTDITIFSAHNHGSTQSITSAADVAITYDTEIVKDTGYTHTAGSSGITITNAGYYIVTCDFGVAVSAGTTVSYVTTWLDLSGTEVEGSRADINVHTNGVRGNCTISKILNISAGAVLKPYARLSTAGNTVATVADRNRISIAKLSDSTPTGVTGSVIGGGVLATITSF